MSTESLARANRQKIERAAERNRQLEPFLRENAHRGSGWLSEQLGLRPQHIQKILKRLDIPLRHKTGPAPGRSHWWHGGRIVDKQGYILIHQPDHPYATKAGYVREHRLVVEKRIARYLLPSEVVHHRDGNPSNNADENLELLPSNGTHIRETVWLGKKHKPETIEKMHQSAVRSWAARGDRTEQKQKAKERNLLLERLRRANPEYKEKRNAQARLRYKEQRLDALPQARRDAASQQELAADD